MVIDTNALEIKLKAHYTSASDWQKRRHNDWKENYELYRDKVIVNRLIQRQSVNIPLMKETIRTILAHVDDAPSIFFENLSNNKQKEIFFNELWDYHFKEDKLELKDIVDKKQVCLYGISSKRLLVENGRIATEILDSYDIVFDRYTDPTDIDATNMATIVRHIYRTLSSLEKNPFYDKGALNELRTFYATEKGIIKATENVESLTAKNQRAQDMGSPDVNNPEVGEIYVELNHYYVRLWNEDVKEMEYFFVVKAEDKILMTKPLEEVLGETSDHYWKNHLPIITWGDDIERNDIYPDGVADIIRTPNKIANAWFSQLVENRTLRSFGMNFYDNTADTGFVPQTWTPTPWGWYPLPGKPDDIVKRVDIPDLKDSMEELSFLIGLVERATATSSQEKGQTSQGSVTLGEVKLAIEKATERITSMAKFYRLANEEYAIKWSKLVESNADILDGVKLFKKSAKVNFFEKQINPKDWKDELGYRVRVVNTAQKEQDDLKQLEKLSAVSQKFPDNVPLNEIIQEKMLNIVNLSTDERKRVLNFEKEKTRAVPVDANAALGQETIGPGMIAGAMPVGNKPAIAVNQ